MKNSRYAIIAAAIIGLSGCALFGPKSTSLSAISTMPAAESSVKFSVTHNDNTRIQLKVKHLAHPDKLTPPANNYVVWTRDTRGAPVQNVGTLKVGSNLDGELDAETPLHSFELFITAEASGQVQQPLGERLLWTSYNR